MGSPWGFVVAWWRRLCLSRIMGVGFRAWSSGLKLQELGLVRHLGFGFKGSGLRVQGFEDQVVI